MNFEIFFLFIFLMDCQNNQLESTNETKKEAENIIKSKTEERKELLVNLSVSMETLRSGFLKERKYLHNI